MKAHESQLFKREASKVLYWTTLLVMTICNFVVAIIVLPMLLVLNGLFILAVIFVIGLIFGMIFNHLVRDISHLERHHHFFAAVFIPALGIIDLVVSVNVANRLGQVIEISNQQDPFLISLVFVVGFMLPYVISGIKSQRR